MQINSVSIVVKYKSIIGIILFNLSKTISFRNYFFYISLALELHLLFWLILIAIKTIVNAQPYIQYSLLAYLQLNKDIEVYVNENILDNFSRMWQKFDQLWRQYMDILEYKKQKQLKILQILLRISYKRLNWLHITGIVIF